jgi:hypothetical protein
MPHKNLDPKLKEVEANLDSRVGYISEALA